MLARRLAAGEARRAGEPRALSASRAARDGHVDVHAHYLPGSYLEELRRCGSETTGLVGRLPIGDAAGEVEARLAAMDAAGIRLQVLSAGPQLPLFADEEGATRAAKLSNDLTARLAAAHPGRFAGFATTPLPHVEAAVKELRRALDELGMLGIALPTTIAGATLGDPRWEPLWAELGRRRAAAFVHPIGCGLRSPWILEHGLTWSVGAPFEDAVATLHLLRAGVSVRHPEVRFVVAHLGGPLPFLLQRLDDNYAAFPNGFPDRPSALLRALWYDTALYHAPSLRCARDGFGAERLLLGSDYPLPDARASERAVACVRDAGLPEAESRAILATNAERLLGLGA